LSVNSKPPSNWTCSVAPWGFVFTALLGCFLNVAIAFNLQVIFVHNYIDTKRFEKYYIIIPLILSLILSILPVSFGVLGYDEKEISCWYKNGSTTDALIWQWTTLHGWILLSILYCLYSVIAVIIRLQVSTRHFIKMNQFSPNSSSLIQDRSYRRQLIINQAVKRIILYPIVPILTFLFNIVSNFLFFTTKRNSIIFQMLANVGTSSQGLLNSLVFCLDPAMRKLWKEMFVKFKINNDHEQNIGSNSSSVEEKLSDNDKYVLL
jgi:hypothetical protein